VRTLKTSSILFKIAPLSFYFENLTIFIIIVVVVVVVVVVIGQSQ